jgi:type II secretory pathway pseudopilin PulG
MNASPETPGPPAGPEAVPQSDAPRRASSLKLAKASLILGIASIPLDLVCIGVLVAIAAIVTGIVSLVRASREKVESQGYAIGGLVAGGIGLVLAPAFLGITAAIAIPNLLQSKMAANEAVVVRHLRSYATGQEVYRANGYSTLPANGGSEEREFADTVRDLGGREADVDAQGNPLRLLSAPIADATGPGSAAQGYYFVDATVESHAFQYGLYALPADYGTTGMNTYYIDERGIVYRQDLEHGDAARLTPERLEDPAAEGWVLSF